MSGDMSQSNRPVEQGEQGELVQPSTRILSHGKTRTIELFIVPMKLSGKEVDAIYIRNIGNLSALKQTKIGASLGYRPATHEENILCAQALNQNPSLLSGAAKEIFNRYMRNHVRDSSSAVKIVNGKITTPPMDPINSETTIAEFYDTWRQDVIAQTARAEGNGRGMLFIREKNS